MKAWEHGLNGYSYRGCRCDVCKKAHTDYQRLGRQKRFDSRVLIDGRLVALGPKHGMPSTFCNWGCRCMPCQAAHDLKNQAMHKRLRESRQQSSHDE